MGFSGKRKYTCLQLVHLILVGGGGGDKHEEKEAGRSREEEKGFAGRRIETCNG